MRDHKHDDGNDFDGSLPTYDWGTAPPHLVTRRQLRDRNLCPGRHEPVARLRCKSCRAWPNRVCTRKAKLYDIRLAKKKRTPTLAQEWALDRAMAARQTCPVCKVRFPKCLPLKRLGSCWPCSDEAAELAASRDRPEPADSIPLPGRPLKPASTAVVPGPFPATTRKEVPV